MARYRKKPVIIEAVQFMGDKKFTGVPKWLDDAHNNATITFDGDNCFIATLEGVMTGNKEDYIIQGVSGEIYPCKPDIFEKTYEIVK